MDKVYIQKPIDSATGGITSVDTAHSMIHQGKAYHCIEVVDLLGNAVRDLQITTPNTTAWAHMLINCDAEAETQFLVYENVTINLAGTACLKVNQNRNSTNTSGLTINYIDNADVASANADTDVSGAATLYSALVGAGKDAGNYFHDHEIILKQNEDYCVRFVSNSAGFVNYSIEWYEHTGIA